MQQLTRTELETALALLSTEESGRYAHGLHGAQMITQVARDLIASPELRRMIRSQGTGLENIMRNDATPRAQRVDEVVARLVELGIHIAFRAARLRNEQRESVKAAGA